MIVLPVVTVGGVVVSVLTVLTVGVVKGVDVAVLAVDTDAVVPVVITGVLAVVCDSVVNVVGVVVVSVKMDMDTFSVNQSYIVTEFSLKPRHKRLKCMTQNLTGNLIEFDRKTVKNIFASLRPVPNICTNI